MPNPKKKHSPSRRDSRRASNWKIEAMGGDNAPEVTVAGAVAAAREFHHDIILVGQETLLKAELAKHKTKGLSLTIHHASETIGMDEPPAQAVRQKKDSSVVV